MNSVSLKTAAGVVMGGIAIKMLKKCVETFYKKKMSESTLNVILLYGNENQEKAKEIGLENLMCIYYVIVRAVRTIDVCMPTLKSDTLARCLLKSAQKNKVNIRVIIHGNHESLSQLESLEQNGVKAKVYNNGFVPLAYEFILVDASGDLDGAVAIMGSLDYDVTRVNCDGDMTTMISNKVVVKTLKIDFEQVWRSI